MSKPITDRELKNIEKLAVNGLEKRLLREVQRQRLLLSQCQTQLSISVGQLETFRENLEKAITYD